MRLKHCNNFQDFRKLAKKKLPSPIFHYIDGAAEDETTYKRNTSAYNDVDLIPNVLRGVENIDLSTTIFGKKLDLPFYCSPTALQRLFHYDGERAVAKEDEKYKAQGLNDFIVYSIHAIGSLSAGVFIALTNWKIMNIMCIPFIIIIILTTIRAEKLSK